MKKIITLFLALVMLFSIMAVAIAEEVAISDTPTTSDVDTETVAEPEADLGTEVVTTTTDTTVSDETGVDVETVVTDGLTDEGSEVSDAGTTPDSPLWGIERALERISVALTFNKAKKAEKRLMHARERLLEVSAMAKKGKLKAAAKAAEANAEDIADAEKDLSEEVEANGETDQVKTLEARLDRHIAVLEKVQAKLLEKGVNAPGIANALAIAKAKKELVLAKDAFKEAKKSGESVEEAKARLQEAKGEFKETRAQIRENKRFVKKSTEGTETESSEEPNAEETETSEEASTEEPATETTSQEEISGTTSSA